MHLSSQSLSHFLSQLLYQNEELVGPDALLATASMVYHAAPDRTAGRIALSSLDRPGDIEAITTGQSAPPKSFEMGQLAFMLSMMSSGEWLDALQSVGLATQLSRKGFLEHDTRRVTDVEVEANIPKAPWYVMATAIGAYDEKATLIVTCGTKLAADTTRWTVKSLGYSHVFLYEGSVPIIDMSPRPTEFVPCRRDNNAMVDVVSILEQVKQHGFGSDFIIIDTTVTHVPRYKVFCFSLDSRGNVTLIEMSGLLATALGASDKKASNAAFDGRLMRPDQLMDVISRSIFRGWYVPTFNQY